MYPPCLRQAPRDLAFWGPGPLKTLQDRGLRLRGSGKGPEDTPTPCPQARWRIHDTVATPGRRGIFSTPEGVAQRVIPERGVYRRHCRKAWQAWHYLDARGGAQGVVPERGVYPRHCRTAWHAWQFLDARESAQGWSLSAVCIHDTTAQQAWHFLDTEGGAQGWSLSAVATRANVATGVALSRRQRRCAGRSS